MVLGVKMKVILASSSASRKKLLRSLGIPFESKPHRVDEEEYKRKIKDPKILCETLAEKKALSVEGGKDIFVIGLDQVVFCENIIFGKPKTHKRAIETLSKLQGRTHELISALFIKKPKGDVFKELSIHKLTMHPLNLSQIEAYLKKDTPYECAGSYKIESLGISLFEKIDSKDFYGIIGLPLISLCRELRVYENFLN